MIRALSLMLIFCIQAICVLVFLHSSRENAAGVGIIGAALIFCLAYVIVDD